MLEYCRRRLALRPAHFNLVNYPSRTRVCGSYQNAAGKAGIQQFGTQSLRHAFRNWLDTTETPIALEQKLMRHADIRTTMNTYGDVVTDQRVRRSSNVAKMALTRANCRAEIIRQGRRLSTL